MQNRSKGKGKQWDIWLLPCLGEERQTKGRTRASYPTKRPGVGGDGEKGKGEGEKKNRCEKRSLQTREEKASVQSASPKMGAAARADRGLCGCGGTTPTYDVDMEGGGKEGVVTKGGGVCEKKKKRNQKVVVNKLPRIELLPF